MQELFKRVQVRRGLVSLDYEKGGTANNEQEAKSHLDVLRGDLPSGLKCCEGSSSSFKYGIY